MLRTQVKTKSIPGWVISGDCHIPLYALYQTCLVLGSLVDGFSVCSALCLIKIVICFRVFSCGAFYLRDPLAYVELCIVSGPQLMRCSICMVYCLILSAFFVLGLSAMQHSTCIHFLALWHILRSVLFQGHK